MLFWSGAVAKIVSSRAKNRKSLISPTHGGVARKKKRICVVIGGGVYIENKVDSLCRQSSGGGASFDRS